MADPKTSTSMSRGCLRGFWRQLRGGSPFAGEIVPTRVPLLAPGSGRPTLPFPHPWNYREPIRILETYFWNAGAIRVSGQHTSYFELPGFAPVLVTRDPALIRAITTDTGDSAGQFERDTLPSDGIARATGADTLLYANGSIWRRHRKAAASPFGKTALFQPDRFREFETTFRKTVVNRLDALRRSFDASGLTTHRLRLEPEIKAVMMELLTNNFFGTEIPYDAIRNRYVPALERVIDDIVRDTVLGKLGISRNRLPAWTAGQKRSRADQQTFDELTTLVLSTRARGAGLWKSFRSDVPDAALRSNLKVFLAGALEATTSYASWAIAHLARHPQSQEKTFACVQGVTSYTPDDLEGASYLGHVLEETLRLTPSLYFLPRRATEDTWVATADGRRLFIPRGTHILLDIWHANRSEEHWGIAATGYPACEFRPERWEEMSLSQKGSKDRLHFGFGHGPRVCPGKHLGQLEVGLVVGAFVKLFRFRALQAENRVTAGVSTKPADGTQVEIELRLGSIEEALAAARERSPRHEPP